MSYIIATGIGQALKLLQQAGGEARVVAGATDLFLEGLPNNLIDLGAVPEMALIEEKKGFLEIGAALTHAQTAGSNLLKLKATALAEASAAIGSPQVRNVATLGGNVANAAPAADAAVALVAMGAVAVLITTDRRKSEIPVEELYAGYNRSAVDSSRQILISFRFKACGKDEGSAFARFAPRKALSLPLLNAAVRIKISDHYIDDLRLVVAPVGPAPTRLYATEEKLRGEKLSEKIWDQIEAAASAEVEVRDSLLRCSARYRKHLVGILAGRALRAAADRALAGKDNYDHV